MLSQHGGENGHAAVDGAGEVLFFHLDNLGNVVSPLPQVGVVVFVLPDYRLHHLVQERMVDAQEFAMTGSPTQQTAQNVASAFIAGQYTVGNHKGGCPDMVGNNPEGYVHLHALTIGSTGQLRHLVGDVHDGVHIEQRVYILADNCQTLQAHAGVDVLLSQLGVVAVAVVVELGEHVVPHFHVPVAVAANGAAFLAAAVLFAPVIVDFRARAAGAGAVFPEVVGLAEAENLLRRHAHFLVPDLEGFVVIFVDGRIQAVLVQANHLGQKLPAPGDGFPLEVVTEGEVAQHFEIGAVTGSFTDVFDIAGTDALLASADPMTGRLHLAGEVGLHRRHAGVNQQQGRIVLRNQRKAGQAQVILAFKERQEHLAQFIYAVGFGIHGLFTSILVCITQKILLLNASMAAKNAAPSNRGDGKSRYHPNSSEKIRHLSRSITGAPVPVIPGNAGSGLQGQAEGLHQIPSR